MDSQIPPTMPTRDQVTIQIVIPTFNRSALLLRAIESVRKQTHPNWRLVVVDNASPDDTSAIVAEAMQKDSRISYHRHDKNIGMLANWEFAISLIDAEYFSLLCDDDYLLPEFLEAAAREITRHPDIGLCFGVTNVIDEDKRQLSVAPNQMATGYYPASVGAVTMMTLQHPATPAIVFRTACLNAVGGFDRHSLYVADLDMILRVAFKYPVIFFEEESACYVVHANNSFKDVQGWHPGLRNLARNLEKLDGLEPSHLAKVYRSFNRHAISPLFLLILRYPKLELNPGVLGSALRGMVEMRQVRNTFTILAGHGVAAVAAARRLSAKRSVKGLGKRIAALFSTRPRLPARSRHPLPASAANESWVLTGLYGSGLTIFLVVFGLAEFVLVHLIDKSKVQSRALLATIRRNFKRSK